MLVVQSSCFAICFPPGNIPCNYLLMYHHCCLISSTRQSMLVGVYSLFVCSNLRWCCARYIVDGLLISCQAH